MNLWRGTPFYWKAVILFVLLLPIMQPPELVAGYAGRFVGLLVIVGMIQIFWPSDEQTLDRDSFGDTAFWKDDEEA